MTGRSPDARGGPVTDRATPAAKSPPRALAGSASGRAAQRRDERPPRSDRRAASGDAHRRLPKDLVPAVRRAEDALQPLDEVGVRIWHALVRRGPVVGHAWKLGADPRDEVVPFRAVGRIPHRSDRVGVRVVNGLRHGRGEQLADGEQLAILVVGLRNERGIGETPQQLLAVPTRDHHVKLVGEARVQDGVRLEAVRRRPHGADDLPKPPRVVQRLRARLPHEPLRAPRQLQQEPHVRVAVALSRPEARDAAIQDLPELVRHRDAVRQHVEQRTQISLLRRAVRVQLTEVLHIHDLHPELANDRRMRSELRTQLLEERAATEHLSAQRCLQCPEVLVAPHDALGEQRAVTTETGPAPAVEELVDLRTAPGRGRHDATLARLRLVPLPRVALMPALLDRIREKINARLDELRPLAREASDLQSAFDALNGVPAAPAARDRRRRRQSGPSAAPRRSGLPRGDIRARVVDYVAANPGSIANDVARALGLNRNSVATRLTQLSRRGDLAKARRGYSAA